jgi:DNA-binding NarL/FixJ family response regulator
MPGVSRVIRVVVVDDQPLIRAGIALLVSAEEDIAIVAEAADGRAP